tara:strand:+ start:2453 stop:3511 length:1059 start_codon:yes stop_codon:yes gene_type:complete
VVISTQFLVDLFISGTACFLASFFACLIMRRVGLHDVPGNRSSHLIPTPRGGGIGIFSGVLLGAFFFASFDGVAFLGPYLIWIIFAICTFLMAALGLLDDFKALRASTRLSIQFLIAAAFTGFGVSLQTLTIPFFGDINLGAWGPLLTVMWIVGFTNVFNFIDGLNGLSIGQTVIACFFLTLVAWHHQNIPVFDLSFIFCTAGLGFLVLNFPRGLIFLGDNGSYFVGFFWAGLALISSIIGVSEISFWTFPLLFFMAIMDISITLTHRLIKRRNIFEPHREYHMQLLHRSGWSHSKVSLLYWGFSILQGILVLLMQKTPVYQHLYFYLPMIGLAAFFFPWVRRHARQAQVAF